VYTKKPAVLDKKNTRFLTKRTHTNMNALKEHDIVHRIMQSACATIAPILAARGIMVRISPTMESNLFKVIQARLRMKDSTHKNAKSEAMHFILACVFNVVRQEPLLEPGDDVRTRELLDELFPDGL
jgi:hypothetical protein